MYDLAVSNTYDVKSTIMADRTKFLIRHESCRQDLWHKRQLTREAFNEKNHQRGQRSREHHVRELQAQCESNRGHVTHHEMRKYEWPLTRPGQWAKDHVKRDRAVKRRRGQSRQDRPTRQRGRPWEDTSTKLRHRQWEQTGNRERARWQHLSPGQWDRNEEHSFPPYSLPVIGLGLSAWRVGGENILEWPIVGHCPVFF